MDQAINIKLAMQIYDLTTIGRNTSNINLPGAGLNAGKGEMDRIGRI